MSKRRRKDDGPLLVPTGIAEIYEHEVDPRFLTLSGMPTLPRDSVTGFKVAAGESIGFKFLAGFGPRAVRAFKLLESAQSKAITDRTAALNAGELELLSRLIGADFVALAWRAYEACKELVHDPGTLDTLDERTAWRITEFLHLFENVMKLGQRNGTLTESQGSQVISLLVRDFGEYYGLLVDDVDRTKRQSVAAIVEYLRAFRRSPHYQAELPIDKMTRLSLQAPLSVNLLDYEIARGLEAHPIAVKERVVRGDDQGQLDEQAPVSFTSHQLQVFYERDLDEQGRAIVNAILPVFAVSAFDGFNSLTDAEAHLARRRSVIHQTEQECFALLQCLHHYRGRVPPRMKEFRASDVMKAAQKSYRQQQNEARQAKAVTAGGMLKERLSDGFRALARPVTFEWPADRTVFRLPGYPETIGFFPQDVTVRHPGREDERFRFLCHAHLDRDPDAETPLMFEYQAVLSDAHLFDAHEALRDLFSDAPDTFRRTLDAGPVVLFAKEALFAEDIDAQTELDEVRLLGRYVALNGGMKSWVGQHYLLSRHQGNVFIRFPDVRDYLSRVLPQT